MLLRLLSVSSRGSRFLLSLSLGSQVFIKRLSGSSVLYPPFCYATATAAAGGNTGNGAFVSGVLFCFLFLSSFKLLLRHQIREANGKPSPSLVSQRESWGCRQTKLAFAVFFWLG